MNSPIFCCPLCKGPLVERLNPAQFECAACERTYPVVCGIPDFRVWPDPYIPVADDWAKGQRVWSDANGHFVEMLDAYWRLTPDVPASMASRFVRYARVGAARGITRLDRVKQIRKAALGPDDVVLDIGCGTGGLVVAASRQAGFVVGADIAARWLMVARAQLEEAGVRNAQLVCACAEFLPFPDRTFTVTVANDVVEHCQDQLRLIGEVRRTLKQKGLLLLSTQNRWSLRGEPHVRLWGVGFLPRRWMRTYVRLVRRVPYRFIRLVSPPELDRLLRSARLWRVCRLLPSLTAAELAGLPFREHLEVRVYQSLSKIPGLRSFILLFGPVLEIAATRTK